VISRAVYKNRQGRRLLTSLAVLALVSGTLVVGSAVVASTPANLFELDGNATSGSEPAATPPDDWDRVCHEVTGADCSTSNDTNGATAVAWTTDTHGAIGPLGECTGNNCTIFTGGGSKDPIDISSWAWKDNAGGLPDKDNLLHGFAARYSIPSSATCPGPAGDTTGATTCDMLFFGNDRYDNSGDAQQGFWFFQNQIGLGTNSVGGGSGFTSSNAPEFHRNGDLLLISDFSNGGTTSTITVYSWDDTCLKGATKPAPGDCGDANLRLLATSAAANCNPADPAISGFCGIVNPTDGTVSPWSFTDKSGNSTYLQGELFEGGVNLSSLGLESECFASVASETRSSQSTTATLKDFVLGNFGKCETTLSTSANFSAGTTIGGGSVSSGTDSATLSVSGAQTWAGQLDFYLCGPMASGVCDAGGVQVTSTAVSQATLQPIASGTATLTSAGRYCWFAKFTPDAATLAKGVKGAEHDGSGGATNAECFTVAKVTPSLTTNAGSSPVDLGTAVTDQATLSGAAKEPGTNGASNGGNATYPSINATDGAYAGTIEFTLKGPADSGCGSNASGTGTNPQTVNVDTTTGNKTYGPVSFTPDSPGKFHWQATYTNSGSANNNSPVTDNGSCDQSREDVTVNQVPTSISTRQFVFPQDKATIAATGGGDLAGNVSFKLYDSLANCTADGATGLLYSEGPLAVSGASPQSKTTNNTSYRQTSDTTGIYWRVTYTSTNQAQLGKSSVCTESTAVTYTGNDAGITIP
jgi:hypothetical protein